MSASYRFSKKAVEDISSIWNYTLKQWDEQQADSYYLQIVEMCMHITKHPKTGKSYDLIHHDLLGIPVGKHIIFYIEQKDGTIFIIRILHSRMDIKSTLFTK